MTNIGIKSSDYIPSGNSTEYKHQELKKACREFESVFTYQILKSMRSTIEKSDLFHGGQGEEIYESLLDQELAKKMARSGENSLADMLYRQLSRQLPSEDGNGKDIDNAGQSGPPRWPLKAVLSSGFGWRKDPFTGENRFHKGIDLAAGEGTPVRAVLSGRVLVSDRQEGYGNRVVLDHGQGFITIYAHNRDNLVKAGDWVGKGSPVALVGSSGRSTGPHLHFEVKRDGRSLDPLKFLGNPAVGGVHNL
jgi:murein DD-endopeptidase MepM/ murein hydrolase activator NlpD